MPSPEWTETERRQLALMLEQNVSAVLASLRAAEGDPPDENREAKRATPLGALLAARNAAEGIEEATSLLVTQARAAGHTWQEIGELLSVTRQAAQQRFGDRAPKRDSAAHPALAQRAAELVQQVNRHDWPAVRADWSPTLLDDLSQERLQTVWDQIVATAGDLQSVGTPQVSAKGPYRIANVPLVFEHGPMRARVVFDHTGAVSGLFILLPEDGEER